MTSVFESQQTKIMKITQGMGKKKNYDGVPCKWMQETFELFNMAP